MLSASVRPTNGNGTLLTAKVKQCSAQAAMDAQPSIRSHGLALWGQQSMSSIEDISIVSADFDERPALPATGSSATDSVIKRTKMVRAIFMFSRKNSRINSFRVK
jgi:hypothetical protein